jgi:hypothetical protein
MPGWLQAFVTANPVIAAAADQWLRSRTGCQPGHS